MATPEEQKRLGLGDDQPTAGLGSQLPDPFTFPPGAPTEPQGNFIPQDQAAPQDPAPQEEGPGRASRIGTQLLDLKSLLEGRRRHSTVERERAEDREMQRAKFERDEARFEFTRTASELNAETERLQQSVLKGNLESQFDDFASAYGDSYNEALTQKGQEAATTKFYADGEKHGYPKSLLDAADSFIRANDRNIEVNALGNLQIQATRALDYYKKHFTKDFIKIQEGGITIPEIAAINDTLPDHMLDKNGRPVDLRLDNKSQFPMLVRALEKGFQIAGVDSTALTKERELSQIPSRRQTVVQGTPEQFGIEPGKKEREAAGERARESASKVAVATNLMNQVMRAGPGAFGISGRIAEIGGGLLEQLSPPAGQDFTEFVAGISPQEMGALRLSAQSFVASQVPEVVGEDSGRISDIELRLTERATKIRDVTASFSQIRGAVTAALMFNMADQDKDRIIAGIPPKNDLSTPEGRRAQGIEFKKKGFSVLQAADAVELFKMQRDNLAESGAGIQ